MIAIPTKITLGTIDALLDQVRADPGAILKFPSVLELRGVLSSTYLQFIISWAAVSTRKEIEFTVSNATSCDLLYRSAETFIPIIFAKKVTVRLRGSSGALPINLAQMQVKGLDFFAPTDGMEAQQNLFGESELMLRNVPSKGPRVHLLACDAYAGHESPHWFYTGGKHLRQVRKKSDMASLVRNVLGTMHKFLISTRKFGGWSTTLPEILGDVLFELVDNTERWARKSLQGEFIQSIRGVQFDVRFDFPKNHTRIESIASDIPLIADFVQYHSSPGRYENLGLLEMVVFDGGPGIPSRELLRREISTPTIEDEYDAARQCLKKYGTTSGQVHRGYGLDRVLDLVSTSRGFVYLRTGRLVLYRDFANDPISQDENSSEGSGFERFVMFDATTRSTKAISHPHVEGTFLSVILPFDSSQAL